MTIRKLALASILIAAGFAAAPAQAKPARCVIDSEGTSYRGPCQYNVARGGTFTLNPSHGRSFGDGVVSLTVYVTGRGVADVRGLTRDGINSRWGRAVRSRRDSACWVGEDFSVCAY
jgi:hypothetical protein